MKNPARWALLPLFALGLPLMAFLVLPDPSGAGPDAVVPLVSLALIGLGSGVLVLRETPGITTSRAALVLGGAYVAACPVALLGTFVGAQAVAAVPGLAGQATWVRWTAMGVVGTLAGLLVFAVAVRLGTPGTEREASDPEPAPSAG